MCVCVCELHIDPGLTLARGCCPAPTGTTAEALSALVGNGEGREGPLSPLIDLGRGVACTCTSSAPLRKNRASAVPSRQVCVCVFYL